MKLIVLRCPTCGAHVDVKEGSKKAVCEYCDTPFYVDDELQRERGDAGENLREAEPAEHAEEYRDQAYAENAFELSRRDSRERDFQKKKKRWQTAVTIFAIAVVLAILLHNGPLFWVLLLLGSIVLVSSRPKRIEARTQSRYEDEICSQKSQIAALLFCILFGMFGVHYFYVGKIGKGILYLLTVGLFGIGWLVDIIRIACGVFRDRDGYPLR